MSRRRAVARADSVGDLRAAARRHVPRPIFEYVEGGAESEISVASSRVAWEQLEFHPRTMRDVSNTRSDALLLGHPSSMPLVLAPAGFARMMHRDGEVAVARAAAAAGLPYVISTLATTSLEDVTAAAPSARIWAQLYVAKDPGLTRDLVARALDADLEALVLTVDTPVSGVRHRDARNGLTFPPRASMRAIPSMMRQPRWWSDLVLGPRLACANLPVQLPMHELFGANFSADVSIAAIDELRGAWPRALIVKGVQRADDALLAVERGADAVVLSHHGGRQLDRSAHPLRYLSEVVERLAGRAEVHIDSGITSGADVAAAVSLGARAAWIGRAYLYGLMAGGEPGVQRTLELFQRDLRRTMQLLGANDVGDLSPDLVSFTGRAFTG